MKYTLNLIERELVHSKSHLEIKTSLWNNMVLRHAFTSDANKKTNLNIALSLTSRMRKNGRPTSNPTIFLLSIQHRYSTWREIYTMITLLMTGYSSPLINSSVQNMFQYLNTGLLHNSCHRFSIAA